MTEIPPKWLGFGNLIMTIHKNSYKRQEGGKLNYNVKKGREDVFSTTKVALKLSLIAVCSGLAECLSLVFYSHVQYCRHDTSGKILFTTCTSGQVVSTRQSELSSGKCISLVY